MNVATKVPTNLKTFFSIQRHSVNLSAGTWPYFQTENVEIMETKGAVAFIPTFNGRFRLHTNFSQRFIRSLYLVRYLQKRFWKERGRFTLVPVPVIRDDYPKGTVALVTTPKGAIDRSYTPIAIRVKKPTVTTISLEEKHLEYYVNVASCYTHIPACFRNTLQPRFSFYTAPGIAAVVQDPNGKFHFYRQNGKIISYVYSSWLSRFLANHFGQYGHYKANIYNHPDFESPVLVFSKNLPDELSFAKTLLSPVKKPTSDDNPRVVLTKSKIQLHPLLPSLIGSVHLMRRGDIFAIVSVPLSFIQYKQYRKYGSICSKELLAILKNTNEKLFQAWECNGIYFFTANADKYMTTTSLAGFVLCRMKRIGRMPFSTVFVRYHCHQVSIPSISSLCLPESKYFSLGVSGNFCLLRPDPNGPYHVWQENKSNNYYIRNVFLCRFLNDHFNGQQVFHIKATKQGLVFSPNPIEEIPEPQTFQDIIAPQVQSKITLYDTPTKKYLQLPVFAMKKLATRVSFYQCGTIWAIVSDKNGPFRFWKNARAIYCADLIPKIRAALNCGEKSVLFIQREKDIIYFSNNRIPDPLPDFSQFKPIE